MGRKKYFFLPLDFPPPPLYNTRMESTTTNNIPAAFIPADMTAPIGVVMIGKRLSTMYPIIGCDIVERIAINPTYTFTMWGDEEARLKDCSNLNLRASCIAGYEVYGNVILSGDKDGEIAPLLMDCPAIFFRELEKRAAEVVALRLLDR